MPIFLKAVKVSKKIFFLHKTIEHGITFFGIKKFHFFHLVLRLGTKGINLIAQGHSVEIKSTSNGNYF